MSEENGNITVTDVPADRVYIIFHTSDLPLIDFSQVLETSAETVRLSVDGTKTFVKWNGVMPSCVEALPWKEGPFTHEEMLQIVNGPDWTEPMILTTPPA